MGTPFRAATLTAISGQQSSANASHRSEVRQKISAGGTQSESLGTPGQPVAIPAVTTTAKTAHEMVPFVIGVPFFSMIFLDDCGTLGPPFTLSIA
jgi:hypothetical protein